MPAASQSRYTAEDQLIWKELLELQGRLLEGRVPETFQKGLDALDIHKHRVPSIEELNVRLKEASDFEILEVTNVSPPLEFFGYLENRKFPMRTHVRPREEFFSVDWPDIFHEVYGHGPFLADRRYADFVQAFGVMGKRADPKYYWQLFRLFWFTAEFGLVGTSLKDMKLYGAGIISCIQETKHIFETSDPIVKPFNLLNVMRTSYKIAFPQPVFYCIQSLDELADIGQEELFEAVVKAKELGNLTHDELISDRWVV